MNTTVKRKWVITGFILFSVVCIWIYFFKCSLDRDLRFFTWKPKIDWIPLRYLFTGKSKNLAGDILLDILNIFGFMILGYVAVPVFKKKPLLFASLYCVLFSFFIESMQYTFWFGSASLGDLLLNSLGGFLGALICVKIYKKFSPKVTNFFYLFVIIVSVICIILGIIFTSLRWPQYTSMMII